METERGTGKSVHGFQVVVQGSFNILELLMLNIAFQKESIDEKQEACEEPEKEEQQKNAIFSGE